MSRVKVEGKHIGRPSENIDWEFIEFLYSDGMDYKEIATKIEVPYATMIRRIQIK